MATRTAGAGTSGRTAYTCNRCGKERFSSNPKADQGVGTTCPICVLGPVPGYGSEAGHTLTGTDR